MKINVIVLILTALILNAFSGDKYSEFSIGGISSRGMLGYGYNFNKNYIGFGLSKYFLFVASRGVDIPLILSYERHLMSSHTPFLGIQFVPSYATYEKNPYNENWNNSFEKGFQLGFLSSNLGYQHVFKLLSIQIDASVNTPLSEYFIEKWRFSWGIGISFTSKKKD